MSAIDNDYQEVYFDKYCDKCKYKDVDDTKGKAPCHECLSEPTNLYSHVPVRFKEKDV